MPVRTLVGGPKPEHQVAKTPRSGRPRNVEAGEVEERILDTATALFMEKGYEGVSFEQIASMAHAGKATIYARHVNKEALFFAVVRRSIESSVVPVASAHDTQASPDLLTGTLLVLLDRMMTSDTVSLTRLVIGELPRFPSLARLIDEFGRQRAIDIVWRSLRADCKSAVVPAGQGRKPPDQSAARLFLDQLFAPLMLRALLGEDLQALRSEIPQRVSDAVAYFHSSPSSMAARPLHRSRAGGKPERSSRRARDA